jgi:CubicO group peptidase (beta-lactamase class C family)
VLLGLIVEKVTGRPLDQVVTNRIIRRLHLRGTSYGTERAQRMTPWLGSVESFGRPVSGDGGIISTVEDVATFFRALLSGNLLAPKQLAEMTGTIATDRPDLRYGLGIWRYRLPCGFAWASPVTRSTSRLPATDPRPWSGQRTTPRRPTGASATDSTAPNPANYTRQRHPAACGAL